MTFLKAEPNCFTLETPAVPPPGSVIKVRAIGAYRLRLIVLLSVDLFSRSSDLDKQRLLVKYCVVRPNGELSVRLYNTKGMKLSAGREVLSA